MIIFGRSSRKMFQAFAYYFFLLSLPLIFTLFTFQGPSAASFLSFHSLFPPFFGALFASPAKRGFINIPLPFTPVNW